MLVSTWFPPRGCGSEAPHGGTKKTLLPKALGFQVAQEILRRKRAVHGLGISSGDAPSGAPARCRCSRWRPVPSATSLVPTSEPPRSSFSSPWRPRGQHYLVSMCPGAPAVCVDTGASSVFRAIRPAQALPPREALGGPADGGPWLGSAARRLSRPHLPPWWGVGGGHEDALPFFVLSPVIEAGGSCACPRDSCQSLRSPSIRAAPEAALSAQTPACQEEAPSLGGSVPQTPRPAPASALWASVSAGGRCGHKELHLTSLRGLNAVTQRRASSELPL